MKKTLAILLALALLVVSLAACGGSGSTASGETSAAQESSGAAEGGSDELVLYTWEGMFPQEVLDAFEADTGIKINYVNFDTDETMLAKLESANGGDYDIVIADDYIIETAVSEGLVTELDKAQIPSFGNINPVYQGQYYDPEDKYTVPYGAGVQTIVYDPSLVDIEITGYADLWDASLKDSIGITSNFRVMNGMALKVMGESYNTDDVATIEKAGEKMLELAPNIRLIKDDNIQDDLLSGEISTAVMYTSQVTMAMLANPELKIVYPSEGIGFGIMGMFIPSAAPHSDAAYKFMEYILDPEVAAQCFEYLGYYCTNLAAEEYIHDEFKAFLTLPEDFNGDSEMIGNISAEAEEAHAKAWTEFKAATGN
ncbi:MAG: spermidine/putrescine ABC transporter substrate-binding protein [Hominenteromicrobium sp.]